jgi:hypothetical protein
MRPSRGRHRRLVKAPQLAAANRIVGCHGVFETAQSRAVGPSTSGRGRWQRRRLLRRVPLYVTGQAGGRLELKLAGTVGYRGACDGRLPPASRWPGRVALGGSACCALGREQRSARDDRRAAGTAACSPGDSRAAVRHPRSPRARGPAGCSPRSRQPTWLHAGCLAGRSVGRRRGCDFSAGAGLPFEVPGRSAPRPPAPRSPFLLALTYRWASARTACPHRNTARNRFRSRRGRHSHGCHDPNTGLNPNGGAPGTGGLPAGGGAVRPPLASLRHGR